MKERGWTDSILRKLLPEPDSHARNPHGKNSGQICLYDKERVHRIEDTAEFRELKDKSRNRRLHAAKAVETRRKRAVEWANSLKIEIPDYDKDTLVKEACRHFNERKAYQEEKYNEWACRNYEEAYENEILGVEPDFTRASLDSEPGFLARITTNYIRHELSGYESLLEKLFGKTGKEECHDILKERINKAIREKYPWLGDNIK